MQEVDILRLRQALELSWQPDTAYRFVEESGNPARGQCYVTARVLQHYFPELEIIEGEVVTPNGSEKHFWNLLGSDGQEFHIDFTWQQFPHGSSVNSWQVCDRDTLNDSEQTVERFEKLLGRVAQSLVTTPSPS